MRVVWLASYPRSGVTFLQHVIEKVTGLPTWTVYREQLDTTGGLISGAEWTPDMPDCLPVYFVKTHQPEYAATAMPAIHLIRDGRDAAISLAHYNRNFRKDTRSLAELVQRIIDGEREFGHWGLHTMAWAAHRMPLAARITYERLITDPVPIVCDALTALNVSVSLDRGAVVSTFAELHERQPAFFRAGTTTRWQNELSTAGVDAFAAQHGMALQWLEVLKREQAAAQAA